MELITLIPVGIAFLITLIIMPIWIRKCRQIGLLWEDMNKFGHPKNVASAGGIVVVLSFILSILIYIAITTFVYGNDLNIIIKIFALLTTILFLAIIGLIDDFFGWKSGGLSWKFRLILAFCASLPLLVINAGESTISLPLIGAVNLGLVYPLILIPIGIAGATTTFNFLAGFNGLEAGQGIIILSFLSLVAYTTGSPWLALIGLVMAASLIAFLIFNWNPAKVFPGDVLTWGVGALIGSMAILGNFEKIALFVFIPYIIETILKVRGKMELSNGKFPNSFGIPDRNNTLKKPYKKIYGLTHLSILILSKFKKNVKEKDIVYLIFAFQIILCLLALIIFGNSLFL